MPHPDHPTPLPPQLVHQLGASLALLLLAQAGHLQRTADAVADATAALHAYLDWAGVMAGGPGPAAAAQTTGTGHSSPSAQDGPDGRVAATTPEINWINLDGPLRPLAGHPQQQQTGSKPQ